jgi:hypothetical protein
MAAVDLDRQAIERRDFPIGRRGYDTGAVDAHLHALAAEFEELRRAAVNGGGELSLASTAASQVQSILEAAETAASKIEGEALENAQRVRADAARDAERTREEAIEKARAHVAAVAKTAESLLERVGSMDSEVGALIDSLRAGAGRLSDDLVAVEKGMDELYDAASGRGPVATEGESAPADSFQVESEGTVATAAPVPEDEPPPRRTAPSPAHAEAPPAGSGDLDGARLIALNMALNGESRAETERYLAENFQTVDRLTLVDEVYAAIEG